MTCTTMSLHFCWAIHHSQLFEFFTRERIPENDVPHVYHVRLALILAFSAAAGVIDLARQTKNSMWSNGFRICLKTLLQLPQAT